jgi:hypothetical protein
VQWGFWCSIAQVHQELVLSHSTEEGAHDFPVRPLLQHAKTLVCEDSITNVHAFTLALVGLVNQDAACTCPIDLETFAPVKRKKTKKAARDGAVLYSSIFY